MTDYEEACKDLAEAEKLLKAALDTLHDIGWAHKLGKTSSLYAIRDMARKAYETIDGFEKELNERH